MNGRNAHIFEGRVVSVAGNVLVMRNREGQETERTLTDDATVICDGTPCQAGDLKSGKRIRVTTRREDFLAATKVEALDRLAVFARSE
jgi:flavoprotein